MNETRIVDRIFVKDVAEHLINVIESDDNTFNEALHYLQRAITAYLSNQIKKPLIGEDYLD